MPMCRFLNVDLEIEGAQDVADVVTALEATRKVVRLHLGATDAGQLAVFELGGPLTRRTERSYSL
jgi:hypothetical protein